MEKSQILIKNMVCPRCIMTVEQTLNNHGIPFLQVELGKVHLNQQIPNSKKNALEKSLSDLGFELLEPGPAALISKIKTLIFSYTHEPPSNLNLSEFLSDKLNQDYSSLSKLFSSVEGITIEKCALKLRIEHVKELIFYDQLSLSEIAYKLDYSSAAHLSNQFKKETGMTPSEFKKLKNRNYKSPDQIV